MAHMGWPVLVVMAWHKLYVEDVASCLFRHGSSMALFAIAVDCHHHRTLPVHHGATITRWLPGHVYPTGHRSTVGRGCVDPVTESTVERGCAPCGTYTSMEQSFCMPQTFAVCPNCNLAMSTHSPTPTCGMLTSSSTHCRICVGVEFSQKDDEAQAKVVQHLRCVLPVLAPQDTMLQIFRKQATTSDPLLVSSAARFHRAGHKTNVSIKRLTTNHVQRRCAANVHSHRRPRPS